ncbi:MAG: dual specificity protein phosphatase family protein [Dehalococcoidia bacterium]
MSGFRRLLGRLGRPDDAPDGGELARRVDRVAPWLFIGPNLLIDQYADLRRRGVTHIVDLREEGSDDADALAELGFRWRRIPVPDRHAPTDAQLAELIAWLDRDADPNTDQALYIHCHAGLGRTPTVAMALLMQHDLKLGEAHRMVFAARPESAPTTRQLEWLQSVEASLQTGRAS